MIGKTRGADVMFDDSLYGTRRYLNYVLSYSTVHIFSDWIVKQIKQSETKKIIIMPILEKKCLKKMKRK